MVVVMSEVKELTPSPAGTAVEPLAADELAEAAGALDEAADELEELDELDELQAAAVTATAAATIVIDPSRPKRRNAPSPCRSK